MAKRYYWLKLKDDFFTQPRIKKLRRIAGGDTMTIIYLKMQLLSLKNEGKLYFEGIEEDFDEELALTLDEDVENVKLTTAYLKAQGLIEVVDEFTYQLPEAESSIGSETAGAKRVRNYREKQKALHCNAVVTDSNATVTESKHLCNVEKEIEIDIEKDIDIDIEKDKRDKNKKTTKRSGFDKILADITNDDLKQTYLDFIKMRKTIKAPMTDRALRQLITKLNKLSSNEDKQIAILEQSIMNCWKGVYPLKEEKESKKNDFSFLDIFDDDLADDNTIEADYKVKE